MKKVAAAFITALVAAINPAGAADAVKVALLANAPPGGPGDKYWRMFEDALKSGLGGRASVEMLVHGQLGGDDILFNAVRRGRGQMGVAGENGYAQAIPEASILTLPFLFSSVDECDFVYDNFWTPEAKRIADTRGIALLQWVEIGWMQLYGRKPMAVPEDIAGYRMRALPYEASAQFLKTVGADTIVLPTPDVIPGLQTGLIDGGESSLLMYLRAGMAEYANHLTMTDHGYAASGLFANKRWLASLTDADRAAVIGAFPSQDFIRRDTRASLVQEVESAKVRGVMVHRPTPEQRARWEAATRPMHRSVIDSLGGEAQHIYDIVMDGRRAFAAQGSAE